MAGSACCLCMCCGDGELLRNMGRRRRAKGVSNADMVCSHGLSRVESSSCIMKKMRWQWRVLMD
jgi:hypothetical protein